MAYTTADLRRLLDDAWDAAPLGGDTLRETLRTLETTAGAAVAGGNPSSISKNSASVSYTFGVGAFTAVDIARAWRELIDLFDIVAANTSGDDDIYAEMKRRLVAVRDFTKDFTCLTH